MRAQASTEYLMIIGFVSFAILGVLVIAYFYTNSASDSINQNELDNMVNKIIATSEYVYYSGSPAQATILIYVPEGVSAISVQDKDLIVTSSSHTGVNVRSFPSNVKINLPTDSELQRLITKGAKKLKIKANANDVDVSLV